MRSIIYGIVLACVIVFNPLSPGPADAADTARPANLQPGPIRHAKLPAELEARIRRFAPVFAEVAPRTHEQWLDGFKRDMNPEDEIVIWETMASAYQRFLSANKVDRAAREEAFTLLLMRSAADDKQVMEAVKPRHLSPAQSRELLRLYAAAPQPIKVSK